MKKFYLLFAALFAWTVVATAGIKNLYKQDFEAVATPADAGWSSPNLAGGMSLVSSDGGKWFNFNLGNNNNRNAVLTWNPADGTIFDGQDVKKYTIKFQWGLEKNPQSNGTAKNTQFSSEIAVLSPHNYVMSEEQTAAGLKATNSINNGQYATADSLRLFSITQLKGAYSEADGVSTNPYWEDANDLSNYAFDFFINGDTDNRITLEEGMWYDITVDVDAEARTIHYTIATLLGDLVKEGDAPIAENCDPYAKGINVLLGRYYSQANIDEVKVQVETEGDFANKPSISLFEVDMNKRTFDIYFEEGEILHVKGTDGAEDTSVEIPYRYVTTTSGVLEAWTENGTATSEHATVDVVCEVLTLPLATVDITSVNAGYVKTYKMTVDNKDVLTQPNITLTYKFVGEGGEVIATKEGEEVASGATITVHEKGVLTVTTHAFGFQENTATINNDTEFAVDKAVDFQHTDEATLLAKGFIEIDPLREDQMSGEKNWTARSRMWFGIENGGATESGYDQHVVYGPTTNTEAEAIRRFFFKSSLMTEEASKTLFAPVYFWYSTAGDGSDVAGLKMNYGIGIINAGAKGDETGAGGTNYPNGVIGIDGLTDNDYYILYVISDYGSSSKHPIYPQGTSVAEGKEMYKAENLGDGTNVQVKRGTETFTMNRIDMAIAKVEVYKAANPTGIETLPYNKVVSDHNAPIYNLNGVQVAPNALTKGIYIKQGKKFVVK